MNRTPEAVYSDEVLDPPLQKNNKDSDLSDGEQSRPIYSDALRSPSPPLKALPESLPLIPRR